MSLYVTIVKDKGPGSMFIPCSNTGAGGHLLVAGTTAICDDHLEDLEEAAKMQDARFFNFSKKQPTDESAKVETQVPDSGSAASKPPTKAEAKAAAKAEAEAEAAAKAAKAAKAAAAADKTPHKLTTESLKGPEPESEKEPKKDVPTPESFKGKEAKS